MRSRLLIAAFVLSASVCAAIPTAQGAEAPSAPNAVYFELFGNGLLYTVNYERMLTNHVGLRLGIGVISLGDDDGGFVDLGGTYYPAVVMANYLVGDSPLRLEIGAGVMSMLNSGNSEFAVSGTLGLRYQSGDGGMVFRIGFTPFYIDKTLFGWGGFSIGYAFRD